MERVSVEMLRKGFLLTQIILGSERCGYRLHHRQWNQWIFIKIIKSTNTRPVKPFEPDLGFDLGLYK